MRCSSQKSCCYAPWPWRKLTSGSPILGHFLNIMKKIPSRQDISVSRALLNNSIEAGLSSALRADAKIQATAPIAEKDSCLDKLRAIFLEKNPLWWRRNHYFKCQQQKGETVNDWWVRKKNKARECNLEDITADDIRLLELIRGVHLVKLRQEFLRTKDPTLDGLLRIARNWQVASKVEKGMETPPS